MSTAEKALAECDRIIALWETAPGDLLSPVLRIGRDVLTRHVPHDDWPGTCARCEEYWECDEVRPWLDLLAPDDE